MFVLFSNFLLKFCVFLIEVKFILFESLLKSLNFLFVSVGLRIEHLSDGCFLFDKLLNFDVFLLKCFLWLGNLILETVNVLLVTNFNFLNLRVVHLSKFKFKSFFLSFKNSLIFNEFGSDCIVFLFKNIDGILIMCFLFEYFGVELLRFEVSLIQKFFEFEILWLDIVNGHHVTLSDGFNFLWIIWLKFQSHRLNLFFSVLFNINQLLSQFLLLFFQSKNLVLTLRWKSLHTSWQLIQFILFFLHWISKFSQLLFINLLCGLTLSFSPLNLQWKLTLQLLNLPIFNSFHFIQFPFQMLNFLYQFLFFILKLL